MVVIYRQGKASNIDREKATMKLKYTASVSYETSNESYNHTKIDAFTSSQDALEWVAQEVARLMVEWYKIDEDGFVIVGKIVNDDLGFDEMHEIRCGV